MAVISCCTADGARRHAGGAGGTAGSPRTPVHGAGRCLTTGSADAVLSDHGDRPGHRGYWRGLDLAPHLAADRVPGHRRRREHGNSAHYLRRATWCTVTDRNVSSEG